LRNQEVAAICCGRDYVQGMIQHRLLNYLFEKASTKSFLFLAQIQSLATSNALNESTENMNAKHFAALFKLFSPRQWCSCQGISAFGNKHKKYQITHQQHKHKQTTNIK